MSTITDESLPHAPACIHFLPLSLAQERLADSRPARRPWLLTGSSWIVPLHTPFSETPIPVPAGSYAPFEAGSSADLSSRFHGGVGLILILRYDHTDVGPYDELILIPGLFSNKHEGEGIKYDWAISRIVVSSDRSTVNVRPPLPPLVSTCSHDAELRSRCSQGRPEWGMPK